MTGTSVISNRDRDCLACRLASGSGLIGAGVYVAYHSRKFNKTPGKVIMHSVAGVLVALGGTRILNLPPFRRQLVEPVIGFGNLVANNKIELPQYSVAMAAQAYFRHSTAIRAPQLWYHTVFTFLYLGILLYQLFYTKVI